MTAPREPRFCRGCGADITSRPKRHFLCLPCFSSAALRLKTENKIATRSGGLTCEQVGLTADRVKALLICCHPDRHHNSPASNDLTRWLLAVRAAINDTRRRGGSR